jgi:hypothetical protein
MNVKIMVAIEMWLMKATEFTQPVSDAINQSTADNPAPRAFSVRHVSHFFTS